MAEDPAIVTEALATAARQDACLQDKIQAAIVLLAHGRLGRAERLLRVLLAAGPGGPLNVMRICRRLLEGEALRERCLGPLAGAGEDFLATTLLVAPSLRPRCVILVFSGLSDQFWLLLEPALILRDDLSVIFVRDASGGMYLAGLDGVGATYQDCVTGFQGLIDALSRLGDSGEKLAVYCIGLSLGGYAAMRFGLDLGARAVLVYGGQTTLDPAHHPGVDSPWSSVLLQAAPQMAVDLLPLYAAAASPPRTRLVFGERNLSDAAAAARARGSSAFTLQPIAGDDRHLPDPATLEDLLSMFIEAADLETAS